MSIYGRERRKKKVEISVILCKQIIIKGTVDTVNGMSDRQW